MGGAQTVWLTTPRHIEDVTEAYPHLLLDPLQCKYFRFVLKGVHYQYHTLCFGVAPAPRIFTKVLGQVIQKIRAAGIQCAPTWTTF